jgi:hypothetical protein
MAVRLLHIDKVSAAKFWFGRPLFRYAPGLLLRYAVGNRSVLKVRTCVRRARLQPLVRNMRCRHIGGAIALVLFLLLEVFMHRTTTFAIAAFVFALNSAACTDAMDEQKKATTAKNEAADKINAANVEADKKVESATTEADRKIAEAQTSFLKLREDYRHKVTVNLVELDAKVDTLGVKLKTAGGKSKVDLDDKLKIIRLRRTEFAAAYTALDGASAATWDAMQMKLDKDWTLLKDLVDKA